MDILWINSEKLIIIPPLTTFLTFVFPRFCGCLSSEFLRFGLHASFTAWKREGFSINRSSNSLRHAPHDNHAHRNLTEWSLDNSLLRFPENQRREGPVRTGRGWGHMAGLEESSFIHWGLTACSTIQSGHAQKSIRPLRSAYTPCQTPSQTGHLSVVA